MLLTCRRCSPRDDGGRSDELAAKYEDVLRARRKATARLPLRRADYTGVAAGTDDDGNDDTPGLRRMRARLPRGHTHSHAGAGVQGRARLETLPRLGARARYRAGWPRRGWSRGSWLGLTTGRRAGCVPRRRELAGSDRDVGAGKTEGGRACVREVEREKREMWVQKRHRGRENRFVRFGEEEQCSWRRLGAPTLACGAACARENGLGRGLVARPSWPGGLGRGGELGRAGWAGEVARAGPTMPAAQGEGWARRWARRANGPRGCSRASWAVAGGALVAAGALGRVLRGGPGGAAGPRGGKRGNGVGCTLGCWAARPSWAERRRRGCWAGFVFPFLFVFHLPYLFSFLSV
jgi:hypothetical protein